MFICPRCRKRIQTNKGVIDMEHECQSVGGDSVVNRESIQVFGQWEDFTGSGGIDSRQQQMWAGITNTLQGTEAGILGAKDFDRNEVGQNKEIFRRRQFIKHDDLNRK